MSNVDLWQMCNAVCKRFDEAKAQNAVLVEQNKIIIAALEKIAANTTPKK
jgi:hypothetical protein